MELRSLYPVLCVATRQALSAVSSSLLPLEQRVCRCDVCGETFVLSYRRGNLAERPGSTVVRNASVYCPLDGCRRGQPVLVPLDATEVTTHEWVGMSGAAGSTPTLGELFRSGAALRREMRAGDSKDARSRLAKPVSSVRRWLARIFRRQGSDA